MFTNEDYRNYFGELEDTYKKALTIYTNVINELSDNSTRSKLYPIMLEGLEAFKTIKRYKEKFPLKT